MFHPSDLPKRRRELTFKAPTRAGQSHTRQEKGEGPTPDSRHRGLLSAALRGDAFQVYFSFSEKQRSALPGAGDTKAQPPPRPGAWQTPGHLPWEVPKVTGKG